jgi:hypothetical protein
MAFTIRFVTFALASVLRVHASGVLRQETEAGNSTGNSVSPVESSLINAERYYIFGYGSLLRVASRIRTACDFGTSFSASKIANLIDHVGLKPTMADCVARVSELKVVPIKVKGIRKGWYSRGKLQIEGLSDFSASEVKRFSSQALDLSPTYLGAVADADWEAHGVIYEVDKDELDRTDKREEGATYYPAWLNSSDIEPLVYGFSLPSGAKIRWYAMHQTMVQLATPQFPICQTYVDLFVSGAHEVQKANNLTDYVVSCVAETDAWSTHWVNDRLAPYRPSSEESSAGSITRTLLQATKQPRTRLSLSTMEAIYFPRRPAISPQPLSRSTQTNSLIIAVLAGLFIVCSF